LFFVFSLSFSLRGYFKKKR